MQHGLRVRCSTRTACDCSAANASIYDRSVTTDVPSRVAIGICQHTGKCASGQFGVECANASRYNPAGRG